MVFLHENLESVSWYQKGFIVSRIRDVFGFWQRSPYNFDIMQDSNFLHFLRLHQDKLFGCNEESSKRIREIILKLELLRKTNQAKEVCHTDKSSWSWHFVFTRLFVPERTLIKISLPCSPLSFFHWVFCSTARRENWPCSVFRSQFVPYYQSPDENEKEWICSTPDSSGMHKCGELPYYEEDEVECHASIETGLYNSSDCINWNQYFTDCKPGAMNPFHGAISFDNIGLAWVAIFLVIFPRTSVLLATSFKSLKLYVATHCLFGD